MYSTVGNRRREEIMESSIWIAVFLLLIIPLMNRRKTTRAAVIQHMQKKRKQNKEITAMIELAKQFEGKDCIVYTVTGSDGIIKGKLKEVSDGGIIIERADGTEAVNLEYVIRIREWPRNSKGKKKTIFE